MIVTTYTNKLTYSHVSGGSIYLQGYLVGNVTEEPWSGQGIDC